MQATNERVEKFKAEAAELNLKAGSANRDSMLQSLGTLLMVAGIVVSFLGWEGGKGASDSRDVQSYTTFAIFGLSLAVTGAAMFLRFGLAKFLRLWLLRQMYEGQSHTDQLVEALKK